MFKRIAIVADSIELLDAPPVGATRYLVPSRKANDLQQSTSQEVKAFEYDAKNFVYFRCRAISADVPNGNGDLFKEPDLIASHKSFVGVGMYMDHDSDSVDKSIGQVLWSEWVPEGKYVECYCRIDRMLAPDMARRIETGQASTVSMGCMVGEAECSVCNNIAHNAMELCEHMIPGRGVKGKRQSDGKVAYEINRMLQFTELSLVTVPADPTARIFEVYAAHKAGVLSAEEVRKYVSEAISGVVNTITATARVTTTENRVPPVTIVSTTTNAPVPTENSVMKPVVVVPGTEPGVVKLVDSQEERMNLSISYQRGPTLASCFFVAKEAGAEFKVSAAEVLPLLVQEAITKSAGEGVATPDQIIAELTQKCANLSAFKAWAKKRAKKNKHAFEKMIEKKDEKGGDKHENPFAKKKEEAAGGEAVAPIASAPAAAPAAPAAPGASMEHPLDTPPAQAEDATDGAHELEPAAGPELAADSVEGLLAQIQDLQRQLEEKQLAHASATAPVKTAVKTEENVMDKRDNGASKGKPSPAKAPAAMQEVSKTENPSGHIDKGTKKGALVKTAGEAGDQPIRSVNPKELESEYSMGKPKMSKPAQAAPPDGDVSWDAKEQKSEQLKHEPGEHKSPVKQYFGRLPAGAASSEQNPPRSMDLKSGVDETLRLKRALNEKDAKISAMEEKERMAAVVDKIADIVSTLLEKNLITAEKEDETIKLLSSKFADVALLDGVHKLVANLSTKAEAAAPAESEEIAGGAAPQVFETVNAGEDAITMMSRIWNS